MRMVVAIIDKLANDIAGPLMLFRHPAPALRMWDDIANDQDPNNKVRKHLTDYEMKVIGHMDDETLTITPTDHLLMNGELWLAQQADKEAGR